ASDIAGNTAAGVTGPIFVVDNTPPVISVGDPSQFFARNGPVSYAISYAEADVITLSPADVTLQHTGTADGTISISGNGNVKRVITISDITGDGTLGIALASGTAIDVAGNLAPAATATLFTVDNTPPDISIGTPSSPLTRTGPVSYTVTYANADVVALNAAAISLIRTGTANGSISVSGTGTIARTVTISSITGD